MNLLGLLRHGPTAWNHGKRIQGVRDIPLDQDGFVPDLWRNVLQTHGPWDLIVASPLSRCLLTARLLFPGREVLVEPCLREQDWGRWTGLTLDEIRSQWPGALEDEERKGWAFAPPGGESRREVLARALIALRAATDGREGTRILLVTHQGVIKVLLNHFAASPFLPGRSIRVAKRALHLIRQHGPDFAIDQLNLEVR